MTSYTSWDQILCLSECNKINPKVVPPCDKINSKDVKCDNDHPLNFEDEGFHDMVTSLTYLVCLPCFIDTMYIIFT